MTDVPFYSWVSVVEEMNQVPFETFQKQTLPHRIVGSLLTLIQEKELLPGDRLPAERELAEIMHVSRPALREALRALAVMNVVEIRPGSGTFVTALKPEQLVAPLEFVFSLDDSSIFHLFEARKTVEMRTMALAAELITDEEIAQLEACLAEAIALAGDPDAGQETDQRFHSLIAEASRNPILARFVSVVNRLAAESRRQFYTRRSRVQAAHEDHQAIVNALQAHDPEAAQEALHKHLAHAEQNLRHLIEAT